MTEHNCPNQQIYPVEECMVCRNEEYVTNQARAEGLGLAIAEAERMLVLATQFGYKEAYIQAFRDYLVCLRPMYERVLRGEYPHPVTHL